MGFGEKKAAMSIQLEHPSSVSELPYPTEGKKKGTGSLGREEKLEV